MEKGKNRISVGSSKSSYSDFFRRASAHATQSNPHRITTNPLKKTKAIPSSKILIQKQKKSKKPKWSFKMVTLSLLGFILTYLGFNHLDKVESFLDHMEVNLMGVSASAEDKNENTKVDPQNKTPSSETPSQAQAKNSSESSGDNPEPEEKSISSKNGESSSSEDPMMSLSQRKRELDNQEEALRKKEAEFEIQKTLLEKRMKELEDVRKSISSVLENRLTTDDKKIDSLVDVYSNMNPQKAAKILESIDESLAIEIIGRMKKKNAAEILNLVKSERAQVFSEKYAGYKLK